MVLLLVPFVDEVCSGLVVLFSPEIEDSLGFGHASLATVLLAIPQLAGVLIETRLLLWAVRPGRAGLSLSMLGAAACFVLTALAPPLLPVALVLAWTFLGVGATIAQAAAVAATDPERAMARWSVLGGIGDLAGPVLCAGVVGFGFGWQAAFVAAAAIFALHAWAARGIRAEVDEELPESVVALARELWATPALLRAVLLTSTAALLDELFVVLGALWLDSRGVPPAERDLAFGACAVGLVVGSATVEPLLARVRAPVVSVVASLGCGIVYVAWLTAPSPLLLGVVGLFAGPLYPLVEARAYAMASPTRVAAAGQLAAAAEVVMVLAVGWLADHVGLRAALAVLLLEPALIGAVAVLDLRRR